MRVSSGAPRRAITPLAQQSVPDPLGPCKQSPLCLITPLKLSPQNLRAVYDKNGAKMVRSRSHCRARSIHVRLSRRTLKARRRWTTRRAFSRMCLVASGSGTM